MSEVCPRVATARQRQRSRHADRQPSRHTPPRPPRRAHPHSHARAPELAPASSISILRFHAAQAALTTHSTHSILHAGRPRTPRALAVLFLATATAASTVQATPLSDMHTVFAKHNTHATLQHLSHTSHALQPHRLACAPSTFPHAHPGQSTQPLLSPPRRAQAASAHGSDSSPTITTISPLLNSSSTANSPPSVGSKPSPLKRLNQRCMNGPVPRLPKLQLPPAANTTETTEHTETTETTEHTETTDHHMNTPDHTDHIDHTRWVRGSPVEPFLIRSMRLPRQELGAAGECSGI